MMGKLGMEILDWVLSVSICVHPWLKQIGNHSCEFVVQKTIYSLGSSDLRLAGLGPLPRLQVAVNEGCCFRYTKRHAT